MVVIPKVCESKHLYHKFDDLPIHSNDSEFHGEHKWEGIVLSIDNEKITSRMYDFKHEDYDEFVFSINQISEDDIELLEEGALFFYFIGYTLENGEKKKSDLIKFRRRVRHSDENIDINDILDTVNELDFDSIIKTY